MHKVYSRGHTHALKGLSVRFNRDEISAFLGHNGAGKSTTMHILTGLYTPTKGTARIDGLDIRTHMNDIRHSLGFVPQHNVLFSNLTVREHLWFYARIKGLSSKQCRDETRKLLEDTGLTDKRDERAKSLSGGMKRKLSVALAFVGGSSTVILDEPSAGVDPSGRRAIWDLLFKNKRGRTIVISTHHMDEADVLGDRISIVANGRLVASGTSYSLKKQYGRGYYLTVTKTTAPGVVDVSPAPANLAELDQIDIVTENDEGEIQPLEKSRHRRHESMAQTELALVKTLDARSSAIHSFVKSRLRDTLLVRVTAHEMTYSVPAVQQRQFEHAFAALEAQMGRLGVTSLGLQDTTLEEIFIKLARQAQRNTGRKEWRCLCCRVPVPGRDCLSRCCSCLVKPSTKYEAKDDEAADKADEKEAALSEETMKLYSSYTRLRVRFAVLQQFYALLIKRFHRVKRNLKGFFAEIVLPVLFILLAIVFETQVPKPGDYPPLELHPWYYTWPNQMFVSKATSVTASFSSDLNTQLGPPVDDIVGTMVYDKTSFGARCVPGYSLMLTSQAQNAPGVLTCNDAYANQSSTPASQAMLDNWAASNFSFTRVSPNCDCSAGFPSCPPGAGGDYNQRQITQPATRDDLVYDLTARNVSDWLVKTEFTTQFFQRRPGGLEFMGNLSQAEVDFFTIFSRNYTTLFNTLAALVNSSSRPPDTPDLSGLVVNRTVKVWYNTKAYVANVAYLNSINNAIVRATLKSQGRTDWAQHGIAAVNHPMPFTSAQYLSNLDSQVMNDLFVAICVIFALSFIPSSFLVFVLEERESHAKQLQFVSGVRPYMYWLANFVWDFLNYLVPCMLCIGIFCAFNVQSYTNPTNFPYLVCLLILYGFACIPLVYPMNYLFSVPSTAFVMSSCINVFIGVVTTMTTTILSQLGSDYQDLKDVNAYLQKVFVWIFPHYCLGEGLLQLAILYNTQQGYLQLGLPATYNPFDFDPIGKNLVALSIHGVLFFTFNLLLQYGFFLRFPPTKNLGSLKLPAKTSQDEDVRGEEKRVLLAQESRKKKKKIKRKKSKTSNAAADSPDEDYVELVNLTKVYKKFNPKCCRGAPLKKNVAVNALSIGIKKGECFGLIGVNGAGKTTTFKMLTGELTPSAGDAYVNGHSVSKELGKVHENIGYCPQFDAIMPLLTAREHLLFFARLRGIPERHVRKVSEWALARLGLSVFADRVSGDFSGGNKRKLSAAIAIVGDPGCICLDEPTSGMDAKARRMLWSDIQSLVGEKNRVVVLTSHNMEECEVLCSRLVIMVNGQFKCLGSPQHLKSKYGGGYHLTVRREDDSRSSETLMEFVQCVRGAFPTCVIKEVYKNLVEFALPSDEYLRLSRVFGLLERNRERFGIKDYSLTQTTLDQIFVDFAKEQKDDGVGGATNGDAGANGSSGLRKRGSHGDDLLFEKLNATNGNQATTVPEYAVVSYRKPLNK